MRRMDGISTSTTLLRLPCGELRGSHADGVHAFRGIPYAEPLTGAARWLPPAPRARWDGVREARAWGPVCMQFGQKANPWSDKKRRYLDACGGNLEVTEDDDCLLLNVWTPAVERGAKLPVMVWIHGGGFSGGAANEVYDGAHLARMGVVCVVIQYRLGPLGFLHGSGLFEGGLCADNRGLLDQVQALKWVQENIAELGGDAGNVTLFGESAGAFAIYQLMASPQAAGLFRRAIPMGGMPGTCAPAQDYHAVAEDVLRDVGVKRGDAQALMALDRPALQRMQKAMSGRVYLNRDPQRYGELGRTKVGAMGAATGTDFLPRAPMEVYAGGTPNDIDLMLGTCADDGQLFSMVFPLPAAWSSRLFMNLFKTLAPGGDLKALLAQYKQLMPGATAARRYDQANTDLFYRMPTIAAAQAHAAAHAGRTWLYEVDLESGIPGLQAIHAIDVALLFAGPVARGLLRDDAATREVSRKMIEAFTSFARSGVPQAQGMPQWQPYDTSTRATMVFDRETRLEADWGARFRRLWDQG